MRSPETMLDLILSVAKKDRRIRSVTLSGSRANKDCSSDIYQDFDIVFYVNDIVPFQDNMKWIDEKFGKPALLQMPESMELIPPDGDGNFVYLMLFPDGNRIDLCITAAPFRGNGEPVILLIDKDGNFPAIQIDEDYWFRKKPCQKHFSDCCNEFHWCLNNVAKGIAREELSYAMEQFNHYVRDMLILMLEWYIGIDYDFKISSGKNGKYFKKLLQPDIYKRFCATYSDADFNNMWKAVFETLYLFDETARKVAQKLNYYFNDFEEKSIEDYMKKVRDGLLKIE